MRRLSSELPDPPERNLDLIEHSETVFDGLRSGPRLWELMHWIGWIVWSRAGQSKNVKRHESLENRNLMAYQMSRLPTGVLIDPSERKVIGSSVGSGPTNTPALLTDPMVGDGKESEPREPGAWTETAP